MGGIITITAGADTGPFNLYSDVDGFISPFEILIPKASLEAGYFTNLIPDGTTAVKIVSDNKNCRTYVFVIGETPTTTTTTTI